MAMGCDGDYFRKSLPLGVSLSGVPLTIAAWFYADDDTSNKVFAALGNSSTTHTFMLRLNSSGVFHVVARSGTWAQGSYSASDHQTGVWHHGCGVFGSNTSRYAYLDGVAGGENTTSSTPAGMDRIAVGTRASTGTEHMDGAVAQVGFWNAALDASEVAALAKGYTPDQVRPDSLVFYYPLDNPAGSHDIMDSDTTTDTGSPVYTFVNPNIIQGKPLTARANLTRLPGF